MLKRFNLRWKILLVLTGLSIVPLVAALFFVSGLTERLIRRDMLQMAEKTGNFVERSTTATQEKIANYLGLLSGNTDLVNTVYNASTSGETGQLQDLARNACRDYHFDLLEILRPDGSLLLRTRPDGPVAGPAPATSDPVIRRSLAGEAASALTSVRGRIAVVVATPVKLPGADCRTPGRHHLSQ